MILFRSNNRPIPAQGRGRGNCRARGRARGRDRGRGRGRGAAQRQPRGRPVDPDLQWANNYITPVNIPFAEPSPGPTQRYPNGPNTSEGSLFDAMFTDDIWDMIVLKTNRYYDQCKVAEPNKHKRRWTPVTKDEIKTFIGIIIHMSIVKLPRMEMYWSRDVLIRQQSIACLMTQTQIADMEVFSFGQQWCSHRKGKSWL